MYDYAALERGTTLDIRNRRPIDDLLLALHLLVPAEKTSSRLMMSETQPFFIEVTSCGYTREGQGASECYPVTNGLGYKLKQCMFIDGQPCWEGRGKHENEYILSEYGCHALNIMEKKFERDAIAFVKKEYPKILYIEHKTVGLCLRSMDHNNFDDFFVGLVFNDLGDEVHYSQGAFSLVRREATKH